VFNVTNWILILAVGSRF